MVYSSDNVVSKNRVTVTSKLNKTHSPNNSTNSLVGIDLYYDSHNNVFSENNVYVYGNDNYLYGMGVLGYYTTMNDPEGRGAVNNQFINNVIRVEGSYCAEGIIIGSSTRLTLIDGNQVNASSTNVTYGITLEMSQNSDIKNNNLTLNSMVIYGIEAFDSNNNKINNNKFDIDAEQGFGFVISNGNYNEIKSNKLFLDLYGDGTITNISTKHYDIIGSGYAGIYLRAYSSNNSIIDNNITISKEYAIIIDEEAVSNNISDNYLNSEKGTGNEAINSTSNNTVENNYFYLVEGTLSDISIKYLENGMFIFTTDNSALNGAIVKFYDFEGTELNSTVLSDGKAEFKYLFSYYYDPGSYKVYAKLFKENYKVTEFEADCFIDYGDLIVTVSNTTGAVAREAKFVACVKDILGNGVSNILVEFYVIDEGYSAYIGKASTNGEGIANLNAIIPKIYDEHPQIKVEIEEQTPFSAASSYGNLTAFWLTDTKISLVSTKLYPDANLAIITDKQGNAIANKKLTLTIGSSSYSLITDSNGVIKMPMIQRGNYAISILFSGDEDYYDYKVSGNIIVLPSIIGNKNYAVFYGNTVQYRVLITGSNGKSVGAGENVVINVNGQIYNVKTDKNGYATKALKLKAGSYTITAQYHGDKVSNKATFKPTLTAKDITKKKAKKINFSVKVVNKNGKAVKKKKVIFKIKGKKYTAKTNKKGVATVTIKNLKVGKYTITSSYGGCTIKNAIKIKK